MNWYKKANLIRLPPKLIINMTNYVKKVYKDYLNYYMANPTATNKQINDFLRKYFDYYYIDEKISGAKPISLPMHFIYRPDINYAAFYHIKNKVIYFNFADYHITLIGHQFEETIEHELIHAIQYMGYDNKKGGLPKKNIKSPITDTELTPHALRDIEYYPNLINIYYKIKRNLDIYAPLYDNDKIKKFILNNNNLSEIKKHNIDKWENAVKLIYQALIESKEESK